MAVVSSRVIDESFSIQDGQRSYRATFRVVCSHRDDSGAVAVVGGAAATPDPIPVYGATYALLGSSDANAFSQSYSTRRENAKDAAAIHLVDVGWDPWPKAGLFDQSSDPLTRPVRIEPYEEEVEELADVGWNVEALSGLGRAADTFGPICNSAGCEYGTPLTRKRIIPGLRFILNVADIASFVALRDAFVGRLNSGTFYDAPARKALCRSITCSPEMVAGGDAYRELTIDVLADPLGFALPLVNRGFKFLGEVESETRLIEATVWDDQEQRETPAAEPINLELDGTPTPDGQEGTVTHWRINDLADFAGLGVGGS